MASKYNSHHAHPMVTVFVFSLVVLTGIAITGFISRSPQTTNSSAQIVQTVHPTPTISPSPYNTCYYAYSKCVKDTVTLSTTCDGPKLCTNKATILKNCANGFQNCNGYEWSTSRPCVLASACNDSKRCGVNSGKCPSTWKCQNEDTVMSYCEPP